MGIPRPKFPTWLHRLADLSVVDNQQGGWHRRRSLSLMFAFLAFFVDSDVGTKPPPHHHRAVGPSLQNPSGC